MILIAGLILAASGGSGAPAAEAPPANAGDQRLICRRDSTVGSRLGGRVCLTRQQWRQREEAEREQGRDIVDRADRENRADPWYGDVQRPQ